jgi:hypothetical protein
VIERRNKDNLPTHIRGAACWNKSNTAEGYQVYDLLSQNYLKVKYNEDNRQWYFIQQDSRSCCWVATQTVPSQFNLGRQSIAPTTVATAEVNDTETGHNQSSTTIEHNQSLSMATQTMPTVMAGCHGLTRASTSADYHWDCSCSYLISLPITMLYDCYQMTLGHVIGEVPEPSMAFYS